MGEVWNPVTSNGEPWPYEVSDQGRVRRSEPHPIGGATYVGKVLKQMLDHSGYPRLFLHNGKGRNFSIHRLVLEAFKGPCPEGMEANHISGIKTDNRLENLEWVTRSENTLHRARVLGKGIGSKQGLAKLTEEDVLEIRRLVEEERWPKKEVGKAYGVWDTTIAAIVNR